MNKKGWFSIFSAGFAVIVLILGITFSCINLNPNQDSIPRSATGPSSSDNWLDGHYQSYWGDGDGSANNPYIISCPEELACLSFYVQQGIDYSGVFFKVSNYLNMSSYYWTPIDGFSGVFDGNGQIISGIFVNENIETHSHGLFGDVMGGSILNVILEDSLINGKEMIGAIVGRARDAIIAGCFVESSVKIEAAGQYVGGIVGYAQNSNIMFCKFMGEIDGTMDIGGIAGSIEAESKVQFCNNEGYLSGRSVAGIVVSVSEHSVISDCVNSAILTATSLAAGIACEVSGSDIIRTYNEAIIMEGDYIGGLVGQLMDSRLINSFNIGEFSNVGFSNAYELVYNVNNSEIRGCVCTNENQNGNNYDPISGGDVGDNRVFTVLFLDELQNLSTKVSFYEGDRASWDEEEAWTKTFKDYWYMNSNGGRPYIRVNKEETKLIFYSAQLISNFGSENTTKTILVVKHPLMESVSFPSYTYSRTGYTLSKWTTSANGSGTVYNTTSSYTLSSNLVLFAQWVIQNYTIYYNANGGTINPSSLSYNIESTNTLATPTLGGFEFLGWKPTSTSGAWVKTQTYAAGTSVQGKYGNVTLKAEWKGQKWFQKASGVDFTTTGAGTEADPYKVTSGGDLAQLALNVFNGTSYSGKYFAQTANINLGGDEWIPIGMSSSSYFSGKYDGQYFTIKGMTITDAYEYCGLFGNVSYSTIKNVNLKDVLIDNSKNSGNCFTGGLIGCSQYGSGDFQNCSVSGTIKVAIGDAGGVIGAMHASTIANCRFSGQVFGSGENVGGLLGCMKYDSGQYVNDCFVSAVVESNKRNAKIGGMIGATRGGEIRRSICDVIVKATGEYPFIGAFAGCQYYAYNAKFFDCSAYGNLYTVDATRAGGFVGVQDGNEKAQFTNCSFVGTSNVDIGYWDSAKDYSNEEESTTKYNNVALIQNCYCQINGKGVYKGSDFSSFTVVPNMNDDLPMQNALYSIALGGQTSSEVIDYLKSKGFTSVS